MRWATFLAGSVRSLGLALLIAIMLVPSAQAAGAAVKAPQFACRPQERTVLRVVGQVELYTRHNYPSAEFACLDGQPYAFAGLTTETGPFPAGKGSPMLQISGSFLAFVGYGCGKEAYCGAPIGFVADLRRHRSVRHARTFLHAVKVRVNERGSIAMVVRDRPLHDIADFPPGPGPFRVEVADRGPRRTIDQGTGIDPLSVTMKGSRVTWKDDGELRTFTVTDRAAMKRR